MAGTNQFCTSRLLFRQLLAGACGAIICGFLFGLLGDFSQQRTLGTLAGVIVGAFLGCGIISGYLGSFSIWIVGFAILGAFVGPGCDFYGPTPAIVGAAFGAYFWLLKWYGLFMLVGGIVGLNLGVAFGPGNALGMLGMVVGVLTGLACGRLIQPTVLIRPSPRASSEVEDSGMLA
jgi:hypothetical protein